MGPRPFELFVMACSLLGISGMAGGLVIGLVAAATRGSVLDRSLMILGLIGVKMLLADVVEVPTGVSLAAVAVILAAATAASLILPETRKPAPKRAG